MKPQIFRSSWESFTEDILDSAYDSIMILDRDGSVIHMNRATLHLLGGNPADYLNKKITALVAEIQELEDDYFEHVSLAQLITRGLIKNHRLTFVGRYQRRIPVLFSASLIRDRDEIVTGVICIAKDLTETVAVDEKLAEERRNAGEQLRELKDFAESIIRNVSDILCVVDGEGKIIRVNGNFSRIFEYTEQELVNKTFFEMFRIDQESGTRCCTDMPGFLAYISARGSSEAEAVLITAGGAEVPIAMSTSKIYQKDKLAWVIISAKDLRESQVIRDLKLKQQQLVQSAKLASLGELSGGIAHELNNPLCIITGFAELMLDRMESGRKVAPADLKSYLQKIRTASDKMARIIRHLREFSRQNERHHVAIGLYHTIEQALALVRQQLYALNIEINIDLTGSEAWVQGDPIQLEQVFIALFSNARDAIVDARRKQGQISVSSSFENESIVVRVRDNGIGIPKYIRERIFDPFFTTKEVGRGTGLGLSMAHGIVVDHRGEITFHSVQGQYTEFVLVFPVVPPVAPPLPRQR